jgi:hypothetical protein
MGPAAARTYVTGVDSILFDREVMENLKRSIFGYRSTWRVLHIDGFEKKSWFEEMAERRLIPAYEPTKFRFFTYAQPIQRPGRSSSTSNRGVRRSNQGSRKSAAVRMALDKSVVAYR